MRKSEVALEDGKKQHERIWLSFMFTVFFVLLSLGLLTRDASGQIISGSLSGTVADSTGAVVPNAEITITNLDTGSVLSVKSSGTGTYMFEALNAGSYRLKATHEGFKTFFSPRIDIHVQQNATLDISLPPGAVNESVTVTAAAPLLQAEDASIGQTVGSQQIDSLPLNGRDWVSLGQLAPGVTTTTSALGGNTSSAFFVVNGISFWQNDFRLNGIDNNIEMFGGSAVGTNASLTPPPDAVEEFRLQSGDYSAEFGHSTGAVVNAVIKSGTNRLSGTLWEYLRNNILDANDYFSKQNGIPIPEYRQNQFGGSVGGPILIPRLYNGTNRSFFFFDYQGLRVVQPSPATSTVPTTSMVNSGFTNLEDLITYNAGTRTDALNRVFPLGTVFDPATTRAVANGSVDPISGLRNNTGSTVYVRDPFYTGGSLNNVTDFTGHPEFLNQIPASRLDPNAVKLLELYPAPTSPGFANNYYIAPKGTQNVNQVDLRIDHTFDAKDILFAAWDWMHSDVYQPGPLPGYANGNVYGSGYTDAPRYLISAGYTHVFTPNLTNEFHFGYTHYYLTNKAVEGDTSGIPEMFGISGIPNEPGNGGLPIFTINGLTNMGVPYYTPTLSPIHSLELSDNVTWLHANHSFKAGYQINSIEGNLTQPAYGRGSFDYSGQFTSVPYNSGGVTGLADLLITPTASTVPNGIDGMGGVTSFSGSNYATPSNHRYYMGAYFQDDYKVTPRLTMNLGIRYDLTTLAAETSGNQANFVPEGGNSAPGIYFIPDKTCHNTRSASFDELLAADNITVKCDSHSATGTYQRLNFAPRVGISYRIFQNLVVRSGYGLAYGALSNGIAGQVLTYNYPFQYVISESSANATTPLTLPNGNTATMENTFSQINLADPSDLTSAEGTALSGIQYHFQTPYVQTYNLTTQYQFDRFDAVQLAYVGSTGKHLDNLGYFNSPSVILPPGANLYNYIPFPDFAPNASYATSNGTSRYDSMQLSYQRQLAAGISVSANYTWSKCFSNQSALSGMFAGYRAEWLPGFGIGHEFALCDTDSTHVIHVSGTVQLPFGRGRQFLAHENRAMNMLVGGWQVNYILTHQSGQPFTLGCPITTNAFFGCFADVVPGVNMYAGPHNQTQWLNPAAFTNPPVATSSNAGFDVLGGSPMQARGPSLNNLDASLFKNFRTVDQTYLQFRVEAFNLTNTPFFNNPGNLDFTNTTNFSEITGLRNQPRVLQLALKLYY